MALYCPQCGEENLRDLARFCDHCGAKLTPEQSDDVTQSLPGQDAGPADVLTRSLAPVAEDTPTRTLPDKVSATSFQNPPEADIPTHILNEAMTDNATRKLNRTGDVLSVVPPPDETEQPTRQLGSPYRGDISQPVEDVPDNGMTKPLPPREEATRLQPSSGNGSTTPPGTGVTETPLRTGQFLLGRYRLASVLGQGGFGAAYLADDIKLNRACVVKQMLAKDKSSIALEIYRANFEQEAKLLVELNHPGHPNIPEIYDYFSDHSGNYLVMKYVEGRNLKQALEQSDNKMPWREAIRYAMDVCSALYYMHTHGQKPIIHRDVKPANILLGNDGRVWLVDFGLAKANPVDSSGALDASQASGSLGYTPLEQWLGQAVPASDVYALGITLHHLITGINPIAAYEGEFNIVKLQELHGHGIDLDKIDKKIPKELSEMLARATAAAAEQRPTPHQLYQQLDVLISGDQKAALYTFRNGKSAQTVGELVDLCDTHYQEAQEYLGNGDFERWFLLTNRNDLAAAASQAAGQSKSSKEGIERFLRLIMPNLIFRRLRKASLHIAQVTVQFLLVLVLVLALVFVAGSYAAEWFLQRSLGSMDWQFSTLAVERENRYSEAFITSKFNDAAAAYVDAIWVEVQPPDVLRVNAIWNNIPLSIPVALRLEDKKPHFYLSTINDIPLYLVGQNISRGINNGVDEAFAKGPLDIARLTIEEDAVTFNAALSGRVPFATATPTATPLPTPTVTPTPVDNTLVVVFNELNQDVVLAIGGQLWDIAANDTQVIELPSGTYDYTVRYKAGNEIAAQGTKTWTLDKAYRLHIGMLGEVEQLD